jgi:hypothetical protein
MADRDPLDETIADVLSAEFDAFTAQISASGLPPAIRSRARGVIEHLPEWVKALQASV